MDDQTSHRDDQNNQDNQVIIYSARGARTAKPKKNT
jgi:hypothetical protein